MLHTQIPAERKPRSAMRAPTGAAQRSRAFMMMMLPLVALLASCQHEQSPTAPDQEEQALTATVVEVADAPQSLAARIAPTRLVTAAAALEDALARVLPALEPGGPTTALDAGLRQLEAQLGGGGGGGGLQRALTEVQNAVDNYKGGAGEEFQPDIGVVQLALDAVAQG